MKDLSDVLSFNVVEQSQRQVICVCVAVSLPRLTDLEWRVDMKMASDSVSRMAVPTCILHMKV